VIQLCSESGCAKPTRTRGLCKTHYNRTLPSYGAPPRDLERRRASWRAKNHRRRASVRGGDFTAEDERAMRARTNRCPMSNCGRKLTDRPFLPNSKELDHIVPRHVFGTHTHGNVRIICRECNEKRPKDGSDYIGQVSLWAQAHDLVGTRPVRGVCACGSRKVKSRCHECRPLRGHGRRPTRKLDGQRAAELRVEGWQWVDIARELGFTPSSAGVMARKYGAPEVIAQWPPDDPHCQTCGIYLPRGGVGRPRKYCAQCRPPAVT
jgi:hypothetical protein